jgi:hypothetical protein
MRLALVLALPLVACAGAEVHATAPVVRASGPTSTASAPPKAPASPDEQACLIVAQDGGPEATAEGRLERALAFDGSSTQLLVLRLTRPRCVVGLPRSEFLTEVYVATTGTDLRPLLDHFVRVRGDAIAGTNDLGGPAVVILVKDVERALPPAPEP